MFNSPANDTPKLQLLSNTIVFIDPLTELTLPPRYCFLRQRRIKNEIMHYDKWEKVEKSSDLEGNQKEVSRVLPGEVESVLKPGFKKAALDVADPGTALSHQSQQPLWSSKWLLAAKIPQTSGCCWYLGLSVCALIFFFTCLFICVFFPSKITSVQNMRSPWDTVAFLRIMYHTPWDVFELRIPTRFNSHFFGAS